MKKAPPIQGLRTVIYYVPDIAQAKAWYVKVLGVKPYFDQDCYIGFNVGGYEFGLHPGKAPKAEKERGAVAYWGVANAKTTLARLLKLGAQPQTGPHDVGEGILMATVVDPFGNIFGIIENPHFKLPSK